MLECLKYYLMQMSNKWKINIHSVAFILLTPCISVFAVLQFFAILLYLFVDLFTHLFHRPVRWSINSCRMDQLKRKLRSGKEMAESNTDVQSLTESQSEDTLSEPKRAKVSDAVDAADVYLSDETEGTQENLESTQAHSADSLGRNDTCVCCFCDFVAKTPTALKIHSKRKHSRRKSDVERNSGKSSLSDDKEMENSPDTDNQPENSVEPPQPETTLQVLQEDALKQSEATSNHHSENGPCDENEAETPQKHSDQSAEGSSGPTQILLEMVDPSLSENRKHDEVKKAGDDGVQSDQAAVTRSSDMEAKRTSKRCPKPKVLHACSYCGHEFRDRPSLETHVKRRHTKEMNYFCEFCSYSCVAKCDYEKHCMSNKHKRKILEKQERSSTIESAGSVEGATEHQCCSCAFTASSSALLDQHKKLQHGAVDRLHCHVCHFYASTADSMQAHLEGELHLQASQEKNTSPEYQHCVEKVLVVPSEGEGADKQNGNMDEQLSEREVEFQITANFSAEENSTGNSPQRRKRGRPKSSYVTTCSLCGLVASNPTNLRVHIRRRHSRLYSFFCKLCNYYCVTKGDMDRHCETKKHVKRLQADGGAGGVVCLDSEQAVPAVEEEEAQATQTKGAIGAEKDNEREEAQSEVPSKKSKYDLVNSCSHCDFVAHSLASLELHVRRKHTRDFEFVCLACSYYALTRREMYRHVATDKHKQKREAYLQKQDRKDSAELGLVPANQTTSSEDPHQSNERHTGLPCSGTPCGSSAHDAGDSTERTEGPDGTEGGENDTTLKTDVEMKEPNQSSAEDVPVQSNGSEDRTVEESEEGDDEDEDSSEMKGDGEIPPLKAALFDECIFLLKVQTEGQQDAEPKPTAGTSSSEGVRKLKPAGADATKGAPNQRIRCEDCGFLADGLSGLNVHISMKHPSKEKHFHCLLCGKSFYTDSNLQQHLSSAAHMRNEQGSVEELPEGGASFKCVRCSEPCGTEQELFLHIKEKHEELLREVNKYVLEDTEQINRERQENQGSVCKYCGKVCKSSNSMAFLAHVRTHTGTARSDYLFTVCTNIHSVLRTKVR